MGKSRWLRGGKRKRGVNKTYTKLTDKLKPHQGYGSESIEERKNVNCIPLPKILASRNPVEELHRLFPSIPEEETPLNVFACALSKEILLQGKMFVTQNYVCFYSNIFGFETRVVIELKDVVLIKREKTVFVVPNAIALKTLRKKFFFCSFLSRETVYKLLSRTWQKALIEAASDCSGKGQDSSEDSDPGSYLGSSELNISNLDTSSRVQYSDRTDYYDDPGNPTNNNDVINNNTNNAKGAASSWSHNGRNLRHNHSTPLKSTATGKNRNGCARWQCRSNEAVLWFKIRIKSHFKRNTTIASFCSFMLIILAVTVFVTSLVLMVRIYFLSNVIRSPSTCSTCSPIIPPGEEGYNEAFYETVGRMRHVVNQNMESVQKAYAVLDDLYDKVIEKTT